MKALFALLLLILFAESAYGQEAPAPLTPQQIAAQIKPLHDKTLILVFDVTESTRHGGVFAEERAASATLIREGCSPGDRIILLPFGTGYRTIFDTTLTDAAQDAGLIDQLPAAPAPGHGTNIRFPHHEALKLIARERLCPGIVVLLTDSFNDRPDLTDPNYPKYLDYYTLRSLTIYPDTPENRDYERLLRTLTRRGCLHQYGVGVAIAPDGRPIERLPIGPGQGDTDTGETTTAPTILAPTGTQKSSSLIPLLLLLLAGLLLLGLIAYWLLNRPVPIRLKLGDRGTPRDYRLPPGAKIALGGSPIASSGVADIFSLAGLPTAVAFIKAERGGVSLVPIPTDTPSPPTLFHNGLRVEQPVPLRVGDEIRIAIPATETDPAREHRIHFEDTRG